MSNPIWQKLSGTLAAAFKLGLSGVTLKNSSGNLLVRNSGDSADAAVTASTINVSNDSLIINSDAVGSGADWTYTLARPASGMSAAKTLTLPPTAGTNGQVLQTDGSGNTSWVSAGSTSLCDKVDTTSLAFGSTSPVTMFTTGAADTLSRIDIIIDTAFNGTPSLSIGISGTTSKYISSTEVDLTAAAGTVFSLYPGVTAQGAESLIATYAAGGASAGAARIEVHYATPG